MKIITEAKKKSIFQKAKKYVKDLVYGKEPNNFVKKIHIDFKVPIKDLNKKWKKAEAIAKKKYKVSDKQFYAYTTGIFKKMLGKDLNKKIKQKKEKDQAAKSKKKTTDEAIINTFLEIKEEIFNKTPYGMDTRQYLFLKEGLVENKAMEIIENTKKYIGNNIDIFDDDSTEDAYLTAFVEKFMEDLLQESGNYKQQGFLLIDLIQEMTSADAVPDGMVGGRPYFKVNDNMFWKMHSKMRKKKGWYKKFYGTKIGAWGKKNPNKPFSIQHAELGIHRFLDVK